MVMVQQNLCTIMEYSVQSGDLSRLGGIVYFYSYTSTDINNILEWHNNI